MSSMTGYGGLPSARRAASAIRVARQWTAAPHPRSSRWRASAAPAKIVGIRSVATLFSFTHHADARPLVSNPMTPVLAPFHLAFPVTSLAKARAFYGELLGC